MASSSKACTIVIDSDSESSDNSSDLDEKDEDTCTRNEMDALFAVKHQILIEEKLSDKRNIYVLKLCSNRSLNTVAAGLSDGIVKVFDIASGGTTISERAHYSSKSLATCAVIGVKFLDETSNQLVVGRTDGTISIYDVRTNNLECVFKDNTEDNVRKITISFDINANNHILCAGTAQVVKDANLLFFDLRQRKLLGGYLDSHSNSITSVSFHPHRSDTLITGATDGLINIFDISQSNEDDALIRTINTESSVRRLNWHKNVYEKDLISCITHTNDLLICNYDEGEILSEYKRKDISNSIKRKFASDCNLIKCHNTDDNSIIVLASSNFDKGKVLRSLKIKNRTLLPFSEFEGNKQIVRDSIFNQESNLIITGGEGGILTIWSYGGDSDIQPTSSSSELKIKSSKLIGKIHGKKPY